MKKNEQESPRAGNFKRRTALSITCPGGCPMLSGGTPILTRSTPSPMATGLTWVPLLNTDLTGESFIERTKDQRPDWGIIPSRRQTDASENITFPILRMWAVKTYSGG